MNYSEVNNVKKDIKKIHNRSLMKKLLFIGVFILLVLTAVSSIYYYLQFQQTKNLIQKPKTVSKQETENMVKKIGKLIELPENEKAQLAKVTDKTKLAEQPFLKKAVDGDVILIYQKAKKAILYRPSTNKIIEVGFINVIAPTPAFFTGLEDLEVAVYNATSKSSYAIVAAREFKKIIPELNITVKSNPQLNTYEESIIVDLNGNQTKLVESIAKQLDLKVMNMPVGEATPEADILIIVTE